VGQLWLRFDWVRFNYKPVTLAFFPNDDQITEAEIGGSCGTRGRNVYEILVGELGRKRPLGRPRRRLDDNMKLCL
jgi:hypothetical protein